MRGVGEAIKSAASKPTWLVIVLTQRVKTRLPLPLPPGSAVEDHSIQSWKAPVRFPRVPSHVQTSTQVLFIGQHLRPQFVRNKLEREN